MPAASPKPQPPYFLGLDIGGSTVKSVLVDASGAPVGEMVEIPSYVKKGFAATLVQLVASADLLCKANRLKKSAIGGIGLDVPAPSCDGVIWGKANLADDWVGRDVRGELSKKMRQPVFMTNDGSAAAFAEFALRGRDIKGLLFCAPGTGLAGGLVLPGGEIYEGANGLAMEIGHVSSPFREAGKLPPCGCGKYGCVEASVSLVALRRHVAQKLASKRYANHPLNDPKIPAEKRAFQLRDYAEQGDAMALEIFRRQGRILGYALADQAHELNPELIVLGGGLAEAKKFRDRYLEFVKEGFAERALPAYQRNPLPPHAETIAFEWAIGGDAAAAVGVASKARELFA